MNEKRVKRVLCIQDVSCVGRCSMTVLLPVLSVMGHQACPLPTAVLSTHYGGFGSPTQLDAEAFGPCALAHWQEQDIYFDAVLSGYLSSPQQASLVQAAIQQNPDALHIVDPAMADGGRFYSAVTPPLCAAMRELCTHARVLTPNATESAALLGLSPDDIPLSATAWHARCAALQKAYPTAQIILITGVRVALEGDPPEQAPLHANLLCQAQKEPQFLPYTAVPQSYPGTGDLFAAVLTGKLLSGCGAQHAAACAADFVAAAAKRTLESGAPSRFGVQFEPLLAQLATPCAPPRL